LTFSIIITAYLKLVKGEPGLPKWIFFGIVKEVGFLQARFTSVAQQQYQSTEGKLAAQTLT